MTYTEESIAHTMLKNPYLLGPYNIDNYVAGLQEQWEPVDATMSLNEALLKALAQTETAQADLDISRYPGQHEEDLQRKAEAAVRRYMRPRPTAPTIAK